MEPDLPGLQPLLPLSRGHTLVGPLLGLAPLGITPLLVFRWKILSAIVSACRSAEGIAVWFG